MVLDIETILDPGLPLAEPSESEGLPAPPHHEIVCIGVLWFGADLVVKRIGIIGDDKDEPGGCWVSPEGKLMKLIVPRA